MLILLDMIAELAFVVHIERLHRKHAVAMPVRLSLSKIFAVLEENLISRLNFKLSSHDKCGHECHGRRANAEVSARRL